MEIPAYVPKPELIPIRHRAAEIDPNYVVEETNPTATGMFKLGFRLPEPKPPETDTTEPQTESHPTP
jgi:hypothetical protein